jgi:hypothetical protein
MILRILKSFEMVLSKIQCSYTFEFYFCASNEIKLMET